MLLLSAADIFKLNIFKYIFQEQYQNVKRSGSRSGSTFGSVGPDLGPNCLQRLSKVPDTNGRIKIQKRLCAIMQARNFMSTFSHWILP